MVVIDEVTYRCYMTPLMDRGETPEDVQRWFLNAIRDLWPVISDWDAIAGFAQRSPYAPSAEICPFVPAAVQQRAAHLEEGAPTVVSNKTCRRAGDTRGSTK